MRRRNFGGETWQPSSFYYEFSDSVEVEGTSYKLLEVLAFCNRERAQPPSITITVLTLKKYNEEFRGVYFLTIREKTLNQISYS